MFLPTVLKVPAPKVEPVKQKKPVARKIIEKDSNTYSFCDRKGLKSDRLSSVYDKAQAPIGDLIQNQQSLNLLQSMENIIQNSKNNNSLREPPKIYVE
jgi:hypothetical protein